MLDNIEEPEDIFRIVVALTFSAVFVFYVGRSLLTSIVEDLSLQSQLLIVLFFMMVISLLIYSYKNNSDVITIE